ncbi:hypothetical protein WH50_21590 [Pokkaliibacter plantistimulans]|uniref:Solute-binding protein family 3/N-terminal domain-containing protein n=1 Tax=Pokkaliibacter plantistimulans TaxID=1635171 RepID=A0ABX5LRK0_9GAMM|nr:ABC transporter substrate-binding protein [Pokkaliibacter plantistimulans]PXF29269.1 hypothetical protein WH50_21590 [Pokkaliibacter plantistimulans]
MNMALAHSKQLCTLLLSSALGLAATLPAFSMADNRQNDILNRHELRTCIWPQYYSISYSNPKTGELEGIDIDLAHEFASRLGVTVQFVPSSHAEFAHDLSEDRCDIAMFGIAITPARQQQVDFSQPYLASAMYAAVRNRNSRISVWQDMDQPGNLVIVQQGTFFENLMKQQLQQAKLVIVSQPQEREAWLKAGRGDAFLTDFPYGKRLIRENDWISLLRAPDDSPRFQYAYAIAKDQPSWLAAINQFVSDMKSSGKLRQLAEKHGLEPMLIP